MTTTAPSSTRPMSADQAAEYLGGALTDAQLIDAAQRGKISHTKLPHDGAYLFFPDDLVSYCMVPEHRRTRDQQVKKSNGRKLPKPPRV